MSRVIALLSLVLPGAIAAAGVKLMRDTVFDILHSPFPWLWLQFLAGLVMFGAGVSFIGGWVAYRDRKHHYSYRNRPPRRNVRHRENAPDTDKNRETRDL